MRKQRFLPWGEAVSRSHGANFAFGRAHSSGCEESVESAHDEQPIP